MDSSFKGPLPNLRIFCVFQIFFPWSPVPRGQLTQLNVTLIEEVPTVASKISQQDNLNQLISLLVDCLVTGGSHSRELLACYICLASPQMDKQFTFRAFMLVSWRIKFPRQEPVENA